MNSQTQIKKALKNPEYINFQGPKAVPRKEKKTETKKTNEGGEKKRTHRKDLGVGRVGGKGFLERRKGVPLLLQLELQLNLQNSLFFFVARHLPFLPSAYGGWKMDSTLVRRLPGEGEGNETTRRLSFVELGDWIRGRRWATTGDGRGDWS